MRKRIIPRDLEKSAMPGNSWLDIPSLSEVELTSEDAAHPIESALLPDGILGWRAAEPGKQVIRIIFYQPQRLQRIFLEFEELHIQRTQEYLLQWSADGERTFREIVRQQWNFSPDGAPRETEDYQVELSNVAALELHINPDIDGGDAYASLARFLLA